MKIQETITISQKNDLILSNLPCGIFEKLFNENEKMYDLRTPLSTQFYLNRSGNKTVGVIYERTYEIAKNYQPFPQRIIAVRELPTSNIDIYALYILTTSEAVLTTVNDEKFYTSDFKEFLVMAEEVTTYYRYVNGMWEIYTGSTDIVSKFTHDDILKLTNELIARNILRPKYLDKWTRIYQVLAEEQYNALYDEDFEENLTGSRNDTTTYDTEVENDGNVGTHEKRTYTGNTADNVYGFNSSSPVGDSTSEDSNEEIVEGDATKNTSHNKQSKTGTDTKGGEYTETKTRRGRKLTPAELLQMELDFRNKQTIMSIILKDVDEETTLKIYL